MLVVDVNALGDVNTLDLRDDVAKSRVRIGEAKQIMRVDGTLGKLLANLDFASVNNARLHLGTRRNGVLPDVAFLIVNREDLLLLVAGDLKCTGDLGQHSKTLGLACFEKLLNTRQTMRDVVTSDATRVERTHRELRARFANRLCGDDADSGADVDGTRGCKIPAIALLANAFVCMARHDSANDDLFDTSSLEFAEFRHRRDIFALVEQNLAVCINDRLEQASTDQVLVDLALLIVQSIRNAVSGLAVEFADDDILRNVNETTCKVTGVCSAQRRVGKALAGAMRRDEVFEHRQTLAEVRLNRTVDDLALRVRHKAAHTGKLSNLLDVTAGAGEGHHVNRVEVIEILGHCIADFLVRFVPDIDDLTVTLFGAHEAHLVILVDCGNLLICNSKDLVVVRRNRCVVDRHGDASARCVMEAGSLQTVENRRNLRGRIAVADVFDEEADLLLVHAVVQERVIIGQNIVERDAADGRGEARTCFHLGHLVERRSNHGVLGETHFDLGLQVNTDTGIVGIAGVGEVHECTTLTREPVAGSREVVQTDDHVLRRDRERAAMGR